MPNFKKKNLNNNLPSFLNSRNGWGELFELKRPSYPHLHQIEPTNACPYNCIMCPRGKHMKRKIGFMEIDLFCKVIDEVSTYSDEIKKKEIELFHFGESLLHPQITEMNAYATSKRLNTVLSVNAAEFNHELSEKLISSKAGKIIVSLDGFDSDSFKTIRGRSIDYNKAIDNIINASDFIKTHDSSTKLVVRMILLTTNSHKTKEFEQFWKEKLINTEIREFFPWGEPEMQDLGTFNKYPPYMPCPFSWQYLVVQWNGDVVACCRDYNGVNVMGNIKDSSLVEIWNGNVYETFRKDMINGIYQNRICGPCMDLYYSESVAKNR